MDSIFRTRGSGVSSDVETTIVPQLLSEIDGVEGLENVIVIGASNREDMIDPAILRPGRLDVKIKIERPDAEAAQDIFSKYLTDTLPINVDDLAEFGGDRRSCLDAMIQRVVERMYDETEENRFLEVTYANGDKETLYFKDFNSGAMIQNIVDRSKKAAIKSVLETGQPGLRVQHLLDAIVDEFAENEDLPNTTNPDDWARISGKKGERIVYIRTLVNSEERRVGSGDRHGEQHRPVPVGTGHRRRRGHRSAAPFRCPRHAWISPHPRGEPRRGRPSSTGCSASGKGMSSTVTYVALAGILLIFALAVVVGIVDARTADALAADRGRTPPRVGGRRTCATTTRRARSRSPAGAERLSDPFTTAAARACA